MIERNLMNGWGTTKTRRRFLIAVLLLYFVLWLLEATWYVNRLDTAIWKMSELKSPGAPVDVESYVFLEVNCNSLGLLCMIAVTVYLAITVVHRENFKGNWYVTLRRIPKYRGKYLCAKFAAVFLPGALYVVYCCLQCLWRWKMYSIRVPEELRTGEAIEAWKLHYDKSFGEIVLYLVLFATSVLLGSLVLRSVKKDILGAVVACSGIVMSVLLLFNMTIPYIWQHPVLLLCFLVVEGLVLVRHVYRKL